MVIRMAFANDADVVTRLAMLVFEGHDEAELLYEMAGVINDEAESAVYLAEVDGEAIGFAQCGLRHDYVEGSSTSPVGYLEGIFVEPAFRRAGIARALADQCAAWAKAKGCAEFASDCLLANEMSLAFHLGAGFAVAERLICFIKKI